MLGAAGLLAKLVELVISKLADKRLGDALSDRRRAGRALFDFYDSLSELEGLTIEFAEVLERAYQHPTGRIFAAWLVGFQARVDSATQRFEKRSDELLQVISLYDAALARLLGSVREGKKGIYWLVASRFFNPTLHPFKLEWRLAQEKGLTAVALSVPDKRLDWFDVNSIYQRLPSRPDRTAAKVDYLRELIKDHLTEFRFDPGDTETIGVLKELLADHALRLSHAREHLRVFIASRFTLEELLYVRPHREHKE
jgi:hypothetical protein